MSNPVQFFIAGTDTGVGKTFVSESLLRAAVSQGLACRVLKPVAAGGELSTSGQWQNEDALALLAACNSEQDYDDINPYCFERALSPHLAAEFEGAHVDVAGLVAHCQSQLAPAHQFALIEGAGGWRVPINQHESMADFAKALKRPVILVVGMRLGCLNHALLSAEAIMADGLVLAGWVANEIDPKMVALNENIETLERLLPAPLLARTPFQQGLASYLNIDIKNFLEIVNI